MHFAKRILQMDTALVRQTLALAAQKEVISFAGGLPAPESFPVEAMRQATDEVYRTQGRAALQYGPSSGYLPLREKLAQRLTGQGISCTAENILIVSGSQQGLDLAGKVFLEPGDLVVIDGMEERIERITEVDIHSFEEKYGDYLSQEQVAREYFVNTGTITSWIRAGKLTPEVQYKFGSKTLYLFSPDEVEKYRKQLGIKEHNDATIKEDFFAFLEERDYSLSYKMPFLLAFIRHVDSIGDAKIEEILEDYIAFYQDRITRGLPVDRSTCPYNETMLQDKKAMQRSMLTNPFEKFERKRFLYYSKDLSVISMNHALYSQMEAGDWKRVRRQMEEDLAEYYAKVEGAVVVKR